jgi:CubicO group peptidase (beta-lactamase class C family)
VNQEQAFQRIDAFVERYMAEKHVVGLSLAITDRYELRYLKGYGFANLEAKTPLTPAFLHEFGSIGKSFTCCVLLQLADEGVIDLHAPVTTYLPWFVVQTEHEPITPHHLMSHTAGIINGTDFTPDARLEVWSARESVAVNPPGTQYHYSNLGYKTLGLMLNRVTGKTYQELVRERILEPLGMHDTEPAITHETRRRLSTGYVAYYDDRPWRPEHGYSQATWLESDTADGTIASTPGDLATYLRMLMQAAAGQDTPVLSAVQFSRMTTPVIEEDEENGWYGYGMTMFERDGRRCFGHGGGMVGYLSTMTADLESGYGVVVFVNSPARREPVERFVLKTMAALQAGQPLPEPPPVDDSYAVEDAAQYVGSYGSASDTFRVEHEGDRLVVVRGEVRHALRRSGEDQFLVDEAGWEYFPLVFEREDGRIVAAHYGGDWYPNERYGGPAQFDYPAAWNAYPGHYRSHNPWEQNFRVVLRKGRLFIDEEVLTLLPDGSFRIGNPEHSPEYVRFDAVVEGKALRANRSGCEFARFFTP